MKNILILPILLMLTAITAHAQSWQWGTAGMSTMGASYVESWGVAADAVGNSYGAGVNIGGNPVTFGGTVTVPYLWRATGTQVVWAKFDSLGNVLWAGGSQGGNAWLTGIATDTAGNLIVFGSFSDSIQIGSITLYVPSSAYRQYFLAKFTPSGTLLWVINDGNVLSSWNAGNVTTDATGNIYITANFNVRTMTVGPYTFTNAASAGTSSDIFVAKYSPSGILAWASSIGGTDEDNSRDIAVASTGDVYITGQTHSPSFTVGSSVCGCPPGTFYGVSLIAKFSSSGVPVWGQVAGGHPGWAEGDALAADTAGNVYMAGAFVDTTISFGTTTLTKPGPGSHAAVFVIRYTPANTVGWSETIGSAGDITPYSVAVSRCGWVWVNGSYASDAYIGRDTLALVPGSDPTFVVGYNTSGALVDYTGIGSGSDDISRITSDKDGNVLLCGDYKMSGLIFGHDTLLYVGGEPFFIAKYNPAFPCCLASYVSGPAVAITSSFGDTVCPDSMVTFTATHTGAGTRPLYQWVVNGHPVGRDTAAYSYIPTAGDSVYCIITSSNPCSSPDTAHSNVIHLSFLSFEYPGISIMANPDTVCVGDTVTFHSFPSYGGPAPGYQWKKNGTIVDTGSTYSYVPAVGDTIWCELTSSFPCLMSRTAMSNKISVVVQDCKAGIALLSPDAIQIAPNPAGSEFTIHLYTALPQGSRADLVDVTGRIVNSQPLSGRSTVISVRSLTTGIYLCRIISANGETVTKKIAVVK